MFGSAHMHSETLNRTVFRSRSSKRKLGQKHLKNEHDPNKPLTIIAGKVCVELTSSEVYAGANNVTVLFNGGEQGEGFLDMSETQLRVLVGSSAFGNKRSSTVAVIQIKDIEVVYLVCKEVAQQPGTSLRSAEFVIGTDAKPYRLFRFKLKDLDLRPVVVEKLCQLSKTPIEVSHIESTVIDEIFGSRIFDSESDEDTIISDHEMESAESRSFYKNSMDKEFDIENLENTEQVEETVNSVGLIENDHITSNGISYSKGDSH